MQRLAVAVSEVCGKDLLVFDEPTSGLDLRSMEEVGGLVRVLADQGKILLVITHDIEFMMRKNPHQPADFLHASKIQAAGGFIENQQILPADLADCGDHGSL